VINPRNVRVTEAVARPVFYRATTRSSLERFDTVRLKLLSDLLDNSSVTESFGMRLSSCALRQLESRAKSRTFTQDAIEYHVGLGKSNV